MHVHDLSPAPGATKKAKRVARATIAGLKALQRPDEVAKRRGLPAESFVPKGMLQAYNERQKQLSAGTTHE